MSRVVGIFIVAQVGAAVVGEANPSPIEANFSHVVEQWGVQEVELHSMHGYSNPFKDVTLQAVFRSGGKIVRVDGFYDGEQTWKVRLMPEAAGRWTFRTRSNDRLLDGKAGSFDVRAPNATNHGPVHVAKVTHFSYADGTPYFLLGTTAYNWLNRDESVQEHTLASLAHSPFTKLRFGLFPKWYQFNRVDPPCYPYVEVAKHQFDFNRFDPKFFAHVEQRIVDLQKLGIEADVILFHPYDRWGFASMDAEHDAAYIRYVVARLAAFRNVWWTMANEYNAWSAKMPQIVLGNAKPLQTKDWDQMFRVLQAADPYAHQRSIHNVGPWYDASKPWITHVAAQEDVTLRRLVRQGLHTYRKPVVIDEYGYEGNIMPGICDLTGQEEVARHWEITMAGGYATHGETFLHPDGVVWWAAGGELIGDSPARLGFLKEIMLAAPFQDLEPSADIVMGGAALAKPGEYYLFQFTHIDPQAPAQIKTEGSGYYRVEWIDPWEMKVYSIGYTSAGSQAFELFSVPHLLRLTKVDHAEPGQPTGSLTDLLARFSGDTTHPQAPAVRPFKRPAEYYSLKFKLDELLADPRARAVIEKYVPNWTRLPTEYPFLGGLPAETLTDFSDTPVTRADRAKISAFAGELGEIAAPQEP